MLSPELVGLAFEIPWVAPIVTDAIPTKRIMQQIKRFPRMAAIIAKPPP